MKALIYLENLERAVFFTSLIENIETITPIYIVDKYSVAKLCQSKNVTYFEIKSDTQKINTNTYEDIIKYSYTYIRGYVTESQALDILGSLERLLEVGELEPDILFIFNGESLIDKYIAHYFKVKKKIFFEIGNFPGRVFADGQGVNAKSSLMTRPFDGNENLKNFSYADIRKVKEKAPPQSKVTISDKILSWIQDVYGVMNRGYIYCDYLSPVKKAKAFVSVFYAKHLIKSYETLLPNAYQKLSNFTFVPLQVSTDTQILFNSDIDNEGLIIEAINKGGNIVIKFHPAEKDYKHVKYIFNKYKDYKNVFFTSSASTPELIKNSSEVYTINSNVGLEAILDNKAVTFFGRTIYSQFDYLKGVTYLNDFLLPIGYPDARGIEPLTCKRLLDRASA